jgi:hypothetical protein
MVMPLLLASRWRSEAIVARKIGAESQAALLEQCASELEAEAQAEALRTVTLTEAVELSGYTYSALEKAVRRGAIPNAGEKHRPLIRVGDLPRKPRRWLKGGNAPALAERVLAGRKGPSHIV